MIDKINQLLQEVEALKAANAEELDGRLPQCGCRTEERSRHETE